MSDVYTTYNSVLVLFNMTKVKLGMVERHFSAKVVRTSQTTVYHFACRRKFQKGATGVISPHIQFFVCFLNTTLKISYRLVLCTIKTVASRSNVFFFFAVKHRIKKQKLMLPDKFYWQNNSCALT